MRSRSAVFLLGVVVYMAGCSDRPADSGSGAIMAGSGADSVMTVGTPSVRGSLLVTAAWLRSNLDRAELVVIQVGGDRDGYEANHIPGARFVAIGDLNEERDGVPNVLRSPESLSRTFAEAGVSSDTHVVVYGDPLPAARAFVALEYIGHQRVSVLDGGLIEWARSGSGEGEAEPVGRAVAAPSETRANIVVDAEWVRERLQDPSVWLIDARPPDQYSGEVAGDRVPRPGHIPGARNLFWETLLVSTEDPRLRNEAELRSLFDEQGVNPEHLLVAYCRTGMQASYAYFVARYLGYDVVIYDGSFVDWSPREGFPVTREP